jgi:carbonic anhydrase
MNAHGLLRVTALALILSSVPVLAVRASEEAKTPRVLRERISADISAGLKKSPVEAHSTKALTSKPAVLPAKGEATAHESEAAAKGEATKPAASEHASAPVHAAAVAEAGTESTPDDVWSELMAGNKRFVEDHPRVRPYTRERIELAGGQHPRAIILGCADSRVSPELVFDQTLGDVFVVRTAGNIVDPIALGSIEYAVEHLHSHLLVVLGHSSCGAVKAAVAGGEMPTTHLQAIVDRIRPTVQRLSSCFEGEELVERSVIGNARQSATDIVANSTLLRDAVSKGELKVVSAVYELKDGEVTLVSAPAATAEANTPKH